MGQTFENKKNKVHTEYVLNKLLNESLTKSWFKILFGLKYANRKRLEMMT